MGLFSFLDNPFRTGATQAAKAAKASGEEFLGKQKEFGEEIRGMTQSAIDIGSQALGGLSDYYTGGPEAQQQYYDDAMASPAYQNYLQGGEEAILRGAAATGGVRGGAVNPALALNQFNVAQGLVDQRLGGMQGLANYGQNAQNQFISGYGNVLSGQGSTMGQIANVDINRAAQKQNMLGGLVNAGAQAYMASDENLKENIIKIGEKNGLNWYSWDWNSSAKGIGLKGSDTGHIAQEVEMVRPDLIGEYKGYKAVNYEGF